jgi:hypothetical protein
MTGGAPGVVTPSEFDANPRHARDKLLLMTNTAMRARRRPRALLVVVVWQALCGLFIAWPFAALVRDAYGHHPRGDAVLFDPEGLALADLAMRGDGVGAAFASAPLVLALSAVVGLVPMAALVVSIGHATLDRGAPSTRAAFERAIEAFGPLVRLLASFGVVQLALLALGIALATLTSTSLTGRLDDAAADLAGGMVFGAFVFAAGCVGVVHDVARCAAIRYRSGALDAIAKARRAMRPGPARVVWSWAWRGAAGLVAVVVAGLVAHRLGGRLGWHVLALAIVHQSVVAWRTALRASWLARALRLVDQAR